MYNATTLKSDLIGLVGWRQNPNGSGYQLTDMLTSSTGLWYNDQHPLLTIDNLRSVAHDPNVQDFTAWLKEKTEAGILFAVDQWINKKFDRKTAKNLLERSNLFDIASTLSDKDTNNSKVVGFEFIPVQSKSTVTTIQKIGIQLDTNQSVTVNLYQSGIVAPIQTTDIVYAGSGGVQWADVNWELSGTGAYYIAYDQNSITGQSIQGTQEYTHRSGSRVIYPSGKFFSARAFSTAESYATLWDTTKNNFTTSTNYGLNFQVSVKCDYTSFISDQKELFKTVIAKSVAALLLRELAFNPNSRLNRHEFNVDRNAVLYELDGDSQGEKQSGIKYELNQAIKAITFDQTGIDRVCLPCTFFGVKYKSI